MKKLFFVVLMLFALSAVYDVSFSEEKPEQKSEEKSGTKPEQRAEYIKALKYYNSKKYKEAVEVLKEHVQKAPSAVDYYLMGYALYKLGKFEEANEAFQEAYLLDPEFSLEKAGLIKKAPEAKAEAEEKVPEAEKPPVTEKKEKQPEAKKEPVPSKEPAKEAKAQKPGDVKVAEVKPAPVAAEKKKPEQKKAEPQKIEPVKPMQPLAKMPELPKLKKDMPIAVPGILKGMIAGSGIIMLIIPLALYIFFSWCLFLIAKKTNASAPWTAWIPIVQIWAVVSSAGKQWWWILLLLIPLLNFFLVIYLWMCISENLGKSKWLGLLMLVPLANIVLLIILAFSKSETQSAIAEETTAS